MIQITAASRLEQLHENLKAAEIAARITPKTMKRIDEVFGIKKGEEAD